MKIGNLLVIATTLICLAACGKKEGGVTSTPELSTPSKSEPVQAQAEVKASSGPVELSLLIHKTQLKVGDSIWQQIRIRNIGEKEIIVAHTALIDPFELRKQSSSGYALYVECIGPNAKPLKVEYNLPANPESDIDHGVSGLLEVNGTNERTMIDGWKKAGLDPEEINRRLLAFNSKKTQSTTQDQRSPAIELLPGQSIASKSAFFYSTQDKIRNRPMPKAIGDFSQLDFFLIDAPGTYKVRATYDLSMTKEEQASYKTSGLSTYGRVRVQTPWISITVLP